MSSTKYLTPGQYRAAKGRLTRAHRKMRESGDPEHVIAAVRAQFEEWDAGNFAYPDDWHDWERALYDALYLNQHGRGGV